MVNIQNRQLKLDDGRRLSYDEYGPPGGKPLFYFHGSPSARVEFSLFGSKALIQALNVRLIAVDRPGIGLSDFQPNRRLLDWPRDVVALADHLNVERFAILAYSLGGPYGLACAFTIPERLTRVGIVSGAALVTKADLVENVNEGTRRYLNLPRERPWAARLFLWLFGTTARLAPRMVVANAASLLPEPDRAVVSVPEIQKDFITMVREALRQGTRGVFHDSLLMVMEWGFRLQDVQTPVLLWHGEDDQNIPVAMARYVADTLPHCDAAFYANEGHLSLFRKNVSDQAP